MYAIRSYYVRDADGRPRALPLRRDDGRADRGALRAADSALPVFVTTTEIVASPPGSLS